MVVVVAEIVIVAMDFSVFQSVFSHAAFFVCFFFFILTLSGVRQGGQHFNGTITQSEASRRSFNTFFFFFKPDFLRDHMCLLD